MRIAVIEDNPDNLEFFRFMLSALGHKPLLAPNGADGVRLAVQERPDLILLDLQMPEMDGFATAALIRSHEHLAKIPIVAVTALAMVGDREEILSRGFDGYIAKPIMPDRLAEQLAEYLPAERPQ